MTQNRHQDKKSDTGKTKNPNNTICQRVPPTGVERGSKPFRT